MVKNISKEQLEQDEKWYKRRHHQIRKAQGWSNKAIEKEWKSLKNKDVSIDEF